MKTLLSFSRIIIIVLYGNQNELYIDPKAHLLQRQHLHLRKQRVVLVAVNTAPYIRCRRLLRLQQLARHIEAGNLADGLGGRARRHCVAGRLERVIVFGLTGFGVESAAADRLNGLIGQLLLLVRQVHRIEDRLAGFVVRR